MPNFTSFFNERHDTSTQGLMAGILAFLLLLYYQER